MNDSATGARRGAAPAVPDSLPASEDRFLFGAAQENEPMESRPEPGVEDAEADTACEPQGAAAASPAGMAVQMVESAEAALPAERDGWPGSEPVADWDDAGADGATPRRWWIPALFAAAAIAWTGWCLYALAATLPAAGWPGPLASVTVLADLAAPLALLGIGYLVWRRGSVREARRFGATAHMLRAESALLEARLQSINNELSLARSFLANQAQEMESVGRVASERLDSHARALAALVAESDARIVHVDEVAARALGNMDRLRGHLPVVTSAAKDLTNQIGNIGRSSHTQVESMIAAMKRINEFGQASEKQVIALGERAGTTMEQLEAAAARMANHCGDQLGRMIEQAGQTEGRLAAAAQQAGDALHDRLQALDERAAELATRIRDLAIRMTEDEEERRASLAEEAAAGQSAFEALSARCRAAIEALAAAREVEERKAEALAGLIENGAGRALAALRTAQDEGLAGTRDWAALLDGLAARLNDGADRLERTRGAAEALRGEGEALARVLADAESRAAEALPARIEAVQAALATTGERIGAFDNRLADAAAALSSLAAGVETLDATLDDRAQRLADTARNGSEALAGRAEQVAALLAQVETLQERLVGSEQALAASLSRQKAALDEVAGAMAARLADTARAVESDLAESGERAVSEAMEARAGALAERLGELVAGALASGREGTRALEEQVAGLSLQLAALEERAKLARAESETRIDHDFSRQVALVTESLNSAAIDVAKLLSNEVTDTAWAAYLKGDRGIFTRRAVRLLDHSELRQLAQHYEQDREFRETVNRYIHDFEAMLRMVLSTREGNAIGVTLLSSDIGKLYVALAQAIERLRT